MRRLLIVISLILPLLAFGQDNAMSLFEQANASYQAKKYKDAIAQYEQIYQQGQESADLYFNLGNSYYESSELGKAILFYERALLLNGSDEDIQYNLQLAEKQLKDEFSQIPDFFLARWWEGVHQTFGSGTWSWLLIFCGWLAVAGLVYWLLGEERARRKQGFLVGLVALVFCGLFFGLARSQRLYEEANPYAIILERKTALRSGPDSASTELLPLHEGTKVKLLDELGAWHKVRLPDGDQGWVEATVLERI